MGGEHSNAAVGTLCCKGFMDASTTYRRVSLFALASISGFPLHMKAHPGLYRPSLGPPVLMLRQGASDSLMFRRGDDWIPVLQ